MSTKVEQASSVTATSSTASTSTPKISMFAAKSGFVIPKNKLSGSLVPIFRGGKKLGGSDPASEESVKEVLRKTKWAPDLTQDPAVRKGRALAYQTRVDQITQQLKLGTLETGDNQDSPGTSSSGLQINSGKSELLELERREAIGEILKLNPSYKAPADYKPLLKEAKVPINIKEYPGYNFIGLISGTAGDTQKRLEKETGTKIRVCGTKADTGEKGEITPSDGHETEHAYEELYVHVCADTYEKIDAAVALIELLVTPVSVNSVAVSTTSNVVPGDIVNVTHPSQGTPTPYSTVPSALLNQGVSPPIIGFGQAPLLHGQFQPYPSQCFPRGPPLGFTTSHQTSSAPLLTNPVQQVSSTPSNMPSLFGPRPVPQNPSFVPSRPQQPMLQSFDRSYMPQPPTLGYMGQPRNPSLQSTTGQPNISGPPPFTAGNQPTPTDPHQMVRPLMPQSAPPGNFVDRPLIPAGWPQPQAPPSASLGPANMPQIARPMVPPRVPHPMAIRSMGPPPFNVTAGNMVSPITTLAIQPPPLLTSTSGHSSTAPMLQKVSPLNSCASGIISPMGSRPVPPPLPSSTPINPPSVAAPKPQHPSSNDFTFQPQRPQLLPPQTSQTLPPSFRPSPPPVMQGFPRPNQMTRPPRLQIMSMAPPRHLTFQNPAPTTPSGLQRSFSPGQQLPFPPRPVQNFPATLNNRPPQGYVSPNQHFNSNHQPFPSGGQQIYDPFSPTSVPKVGGGNPPKESDPEYEDLMASVGVK